MKSGHSSALKPDRLGLRCKANKCSDAGTGDLGVLRTHETSSFLGDAGTSKHLWSVVFLIEVALKINKRTVQPSKLEGPPPLDGQGIPEGTSPCQPKAVE